MMDLRQLLNEEQIKPVEALEGPVMVLAGAGSGKTRVLTYRIANLIMHGVNPKSILAITFTNKAANEMKERIFDVTGIADIAISTFHSFCVKLLRQFIFKVGDFTNNFTIYDEEDSDKLLKKIIKQVCEEDEIDEDEFKKFIKQVKWHISNAKSTGHSPETYERVIFADPLRAKVIEIFSRYNIELQKNNAIDFDDILLFTVKLFANCPDVLEECQDRYQYIHVDEFQDTNKIQFTILRFLGQKYQNVFVVGDEDQSIYGWRGADYTNIKNFRKTFCGCQTFKLEQNYRSTKNILNAANALIANNRDRHAKVLWTENKEGAKIEVKESSDEKDEADYVLGVINHLKRNYDYSYKDFAVLVRTTTITMPLEEKLRLYNIPYRMIGGRKFYDRKEVKDFLAYLKIVCNPKDEMSILRVINVPKRGIGEGAVSKLKLACEERSMSLFEGLIYINDLGLTTAIYKKLFPFAALVRDFYSKKDMPLVDYIDYVEKEIDFSRMYDINKEEDAARLENIKELKRSIVEYNKDNPLSTLSEYLQSVTLLTSDDKDDEFDQDVLTVATVHGVKGLEFKCVFIIGLEEGIFPIKRFDVQQDETEEERRIMYVAMTRAKQRLYLTHTKSRFRFGSRVNNSVSQYIKEAKLNKNILQEYKMFESTTPIKKRTIDFTLTQKRETPSFAQKNTIAPANDKDLSIFKVGQTVEHARFGVGTILTIIGEQADISFETLGVKKFNLRLAPITVVE